jgi:hypothetical protein
MCQLHVHVFLGTCLCECTCVAHHTPVMLDACSVEAEKEVVARTSILRASTASPTSQGHHGTSLLCMPPVASTSYACDAPSGCGSSNSPGRARQASLSPASPAAAGGTAGAGSVPCNSRPSFSADARGFGSFAFGARASGAAAVAGAAHGQLPCALGAPAGSCYTEQDLEALLAAFNEERRLMGKRHAAAEAAAAQLQAQVRGGW